MEQTCRKTVKEVEKTSHEKHDSRLDGHAAGDKKDGKAARDQVAAGDGVGEVLFDGHFVALLCPAKVMFFLMLNDEC